MSVPVLFDTSVLIPLVNTGAHEGLFRQTVRSGRALLCSVVVQELYAGTPDLAAKRELDALNRAFGRAGMVVTPEHEDWCTAGTLLARYGRLHGRVVPRDHLADVLIVLCAARRSAVLVSENARDMRRWAALVQPARRRPTVRTPAQLGGRAP